MVLLYSHLLMLAFAISASSGQHCQKLYEDSFKPRDGEQRLMERGHVTMVWGTPPALAAAALARAALVAAGMPPADVSLLQHDGSTSLCELLDCKQSQCDFSRGLKSNSVSGVATVVVVLATAWRRGGGGACRWDADAVLRVTSAGVAPVAARLQARLAGQYKDSRACDAVHTWRFHEDAAARLACGFMDSENKPVPVYVVKGEWEAAQRELEARLNGSMQIFSVPRFAETPAESLASLVSAGNRSFLFVDAELWGNETRLVQPPPPAAGGDAPLDAAVSLAVADEFNLRVHALPLHTLLGQFAPSGTALLAVLRQAHAAQPTAGVAAAAAEEAACAWSWANDDNKRTFAAWRIAAAKEFSKSALVYLCDVDNLMETAYKNMLNVVADYVNCGHYPCGNTTTFKHNIVTRGLTFSGCDRPDIDVRFMEDLRRMKDFGTLASVLYVLVPAGVVETLAPFARRERFPLVAYDLAVGASDATYRTAGGAAAPLALALRRLLAAFGWRRVAVVSEETAAAAAVMAALPVATHSPLLLREKRFSSNDNASIERALDELVGDDARVFLVNAGARAAAAVLRAASRRDLTPERGYAWIVREYEANDDATERLRPYSVSYQWRGPPAEPEAGEARDAVLETAPPEVKLRRWLLEANGRPWPCYLASIADALLILAKGYERLLDSTSKNAFTDKEDDKVSYFWAGVQSGNISGLFENITFDEHGNVVPRIFVEQWGIDRNVNGPHRLATWRAGQEGARNEGLPRPQVSDGADSWCVVRTGDAFNPRCEDGAWFGGGAATLLAVAAATLALLRNRRRRRRRELRRRAKCEAELLSRWVRAFAGMGPRLVRRAALELGDELGSGRFGLVRLGRLRTPGRSRPALVAVKALREGAGPEDEGQFLKEACTVAALAHAHVVRFEGACVEGGPPLLLMEYAFFGNLRAYLCERRHLAESGEAEAEAAAVAPEELTRLAREAAEALAYLAAHGLVHRDVRAANCLVDARRALKLADFGLARETGATDGEYACRSRAMFPVLWMAPESLALGVCSPASDVWAFGVLALEVVTLGERPYGAASAEAVMRTVLSGGRPPLPSDASAETRALLRSCWRRAPSARPAPRELARRLAAPAGCATLRPALARQLEDADVDSGFGEPPAPRRLSGPPPPSPLELGRLIPVP